MAGRWTDLGPVQLLVIAFEDGSFDAAILEELRRLREHDAVHLIDLLFVAKDERGGVAELEQGDLSAEEATEFGALVEALIGFEPDRRDEADTVAGVAAITGNGSPRNPEEVWFLADAIPPGTSAALALLEHRWAIPLRDAIASAGGHDLVDRWIHPGDLAVALGKSRD
jgi:hypothetical protein